MEERASVQLPGKRMGAYALKLPDTRIYHTLTILVIGAFPTIIIVTGIFVYYKRRRL